MLVNQAGEPVGHVTSFRDADGDWHASAVYYGEPPATLTKLYTAPQPDSGRAADAIYAALENSRKRSAELEAELDSLKAIHRQTVSEGVAGFQALRAEADRAREAAELAHTFINAAAGEGLVLDGVDAGELYVKLYPERYAKAVAGLGERGQDDAP